MHLVFLLHELDDLLTARTKKKKGVLMHELDKNFMPTLYDEYYSTLSKKIVSFCTNLSVFLLFELEEKGVPNARTG